MISDKNYYVNQIVSACCNGLTRNNESLCIRLGLILHIICFDANTQIVFYRFAVYFDPLDNNLLVLTENRNSCQQKRKDSTEQ